MTTARASKARLAHGRNLLGAVRIHLGQLRNELSRQNVLRQLGDDPTAAIRSPHDAIHIAHTLLDPLARHDTNTAVWASIAIRPLAELLYAASTQHGAGSGIDWAWHALVNAEAPTTVPGWRQAAEIWDQAAGAALPGQLCSIAELPPRQRNSVIHTMHAAIAPWLPRTRR
ncbi:hypothetical protein AB0876_32985 [Mycobacterium sp. NPDC049093]